MQLEHLEDVYSCAEHSDLFWFYVTSTIVGYLKPNPFYFYKKFYF